MKWMIDTIGGFIHYLLKNLISKNREYDGKCWNIMIHCIVMIKLWDGEKMTEKRLIVDENYNLVDTVTGEWLDDTQVFDLANELAEENEQLKQFIQELTTKGTGKIHLANGNIYKVNAILTDFNR